MHREQEYKLWKKVNNTGVYHISWTISYSSMILREQRNLQGLKFNVNNVPYFEINVALF